MRRIGKWLAIYMATFLAIVIVANVDEILTGRFPVFTLADFVRHLFFAALGTGLILQMKGELREIKNPQ